MPYILVRHKVRDYAKWKAVFDDHAVERKSAGGSVQAQVFRSIDSPNEVFILVQGTSDERSRRFIESDNLRQAMIDAGVIDRPDVYFLELADETDG